MSLASASDFFSHIVSHIHLSAGSENQGQVCVFSFFRTSSPSPNHIRSEFVYSGAQHLLVCIQVPIQTSDQMVLEVDETLKLLLVFDITQLIQFLYYYVA